MKKAYKKLSWYGMILLFAISILAGKQLYSQVELTPFAGYMMNGNIRFIEGDLSFSNNLDYGVILEYQ